MGFGLFRGGIGWRCAGLRAGAIFFGGFGLFCMVAAMAGEGHILTWWVDPGESFAARATVYASSLVLLVWGWHPGPGRVRRLGMQLAVAFLLLAALSDTITFWVLYAGGRLESAFPLPLSLLVAAMLAAIFWEAAFAERSNTDRRWLVVALVPVWACAFALLQMVCFGRTDYRRPADAVVVLGARAYADGRPSDALADRVTTACRLYHEGLAAHLIMSGGPGDGAFHETEAMRDLAVRLGVPESVILLDRNGLNTRMTAANVGRIQQAGDGLPPKT